MSSGRNLQLDSVRGLAAISVFVFHASNRIEALYGTPYRFFGHLDFGVRVFFLLSGYFIYRPFVRSHLREGKGLALREYTWKRFWRIYPAYWIALLFVIAVGYTGVDGFSGLIKHGLLAQSYFGDEGGRGMRASWTLVVEVLLYFLIPIVAIGVRWLGRLIGRSRAELLMVASFFSAAIVSVLPYVYSKGIFASPGIARVLESAAVPVSIGMLLAVLESIDLDPNWRERITRFASPIGLWWLSAGVVLIVLATWLADGFIRPGRPHTGTDWYNLQWGHALIAALLVTPLVLAPDAGGRLRRALSTRHLVTVGTVSFSLYLWHGAVIRFVHELGWFDSLSSAIPAALGAFFASAGIGWLGQRYIEKPCARVASAYRPRG